MKNEQQLESFGYLPDSIETSVSKAINRDFIVSVIFIESKSRNLETALMIAKKADYFEENLVNNQKMYLVVFGKNYIQCNLIEPLISIVKNWKGTFVFTKGRQVTNIKAMLKTVKCIRQAILSRSTQSHCVRILPNIGVDHLIMHPKYGYYVRNEPTIPRQWVFPCALLSTHNHTDQLDIRKNIPLTDQLHDLAVRNECDWCPNLKINDLEVLDRKTKLKDLK